MLHLVRMARGLTQSELSQRSGVSQAVLSKVESGGADLDPARVGELARALKVPVARLTTQGVGDGVLSACAFHRKRASLAVSDAKRIRAVLNLRRLQVEGLVSPHDVAVTLPRRRPSDDGWDSPETIALEVRETLGLAGGPIRDLVAAVEATGAIVMLANLGAARIDAIGSWPAGHRPIFMINATTPADRRRFSLAHEVAHAVLHEIPGPEQEAEADRFASELLMPASAIRAELSCLDLPRLATLKARWGVSMAALVRRAHDLNTISDYEYKQLNIALSTAGYRTREPVDLTPEVPQFVTGVIAGRRDRGESIQHLAEATLMTAHEFTTVYLGSPDEH